MAVVLMFRTLFWSIASHLEQQHSPSSIPAPAFYFDTDVQLRNLLKDSFPLLDSDLEALESYQKSILPRFVSIESNALHAESPQHLKRLCHSHGIASHIEFAFSSGSAVDARRKPCMRSGHRSGHCCWAEGCIFLDLGV